MEISKALRSDMIDILLRDKRSNVMLNNAKKVEKAISQLIKGQNGMLRYIKTDVQN